MMHLSQGHLNREEMAETLLEEGSGWERARRQRHLDQCAACRAELDGLRADLEAAAALVDGAVRERDQDWADEQWRRLRPQLEPWAENRRRGMGLGPRLAWAAGVAVLVAGAFAAGRAWEQRQRPVVAVVQSAPPVAPRTATQSKTPGADAAAPQTAPRPVVVVLLADHLDRSERLLVELKHADLASDETAPALRQEARSLLEENRLARQHAQAKGDPALQGALERLDTLLDQIANQPEELTQGDLMRLRDQMNAAGLLFEVRVLRSRMPGGGTAAAAGKHGGEA